MADALVAILIAALLASGILGINAQAHRLSASANNELLAAQLARSILLKPTTEQRGTADLDGKEFQWTLKRTADRHLVHLEVEVTFERRRRWQSKVYRTTVLGGHDAE